MDGLVQSENAKVLELWGFPSMGDPLNGRFINPMITWMIWNWGTAKWMVWYGNAYENG